MIDHIQNFIDFMTDKGCPPASSADIKADDTWCDFQILGDPAKKKKGFYTLCIDGDYVSGACGDRRNGEVYQYRGKPARKLTDQERRKWARRREADRKAKKLEKLELNQKAAAKALNIWRNASKNLNHEYLKKKNISGSWCRQSGEELLVPMYGEDGKLWNVQSIFPDSEKSFLFGGRKKGCYAPIAEKGDDKSVIYITEGYADGESIRAATGAVVVVAFDAGNLKPVCLLMKNKYPSAQIIIAGDNDESQTGQKKSTEAAQAVNGIAIWPDEEGKDWNDIHIEHGLDYVKNSVAAMVADRAGSDKGQPVPPYAVAAKDASSPTATYKPEWREAAICNGDGKLVKSSLKNFILMMENHEDFKGVFRLNDFQKEVFVAKCPVWEDENNFQVHRLEDNDITQAAAELERFGLSGDTDKAFKAIRVAAERHAFHPAREYFNSLEWDGTTRLEKWLSYYMGAEGEDEAYLSFIGKKWLTAAVKRIFEPGCKFDHILVMEGKQGRGKSTAFETLATFGKEKKQAYFTDNIKLSDIQSKDTILLLQGSIIVELAELAGFSKKEDDEIKGWITVKEDRCRVPYGKTITHFPRQFVLCATTNNYDYLKDPTGNRRYWPFTSLSVDIDAIERDKEQLWAEAVTLYKSGLYLGPTEDEMKLAEIAQDKRRTYDAWEEDVVEAIEKLGMLKDQGFKTKDIFRKMGLTLKEQDGRNTRRIAGILQQLGYESKGKKINKTTQRVWIKEN